jgi:hypothetical protein
MTIRYKRIGKDTLCPPRDHARKPIVNDSAVTGWGNNRYISIRGREDFIAWKKTAKPLFTTKSEDANCLLGF